MPAQTVRSERNPLPAHGAAGMAVFQRDLSKREDAEPHDAEEEVQDQPDGFLLQLQPDTPGGEQGHDECRDADDRCR